MKQPILSAVLSTACFFLLTFTVQAFIPHEFKSNFLSRKGALSRNVILHAAAPDGRTCRARDLILSLVEEDQCFTTETGARAFGDACAIDIVYEDRFEPQPMVRKTVRTETYIGTLLYESFKSIPRFYHCSDPPLDSYLLY
jgi:hypothetical protein